MPVYKGLIFYFYYFKQLLVFVKWRAQKYDNIEVNTDISPGEFKKILKDLTGVPEERQKVFISGAVLGDESFEGIKIKNVENFFLFDDFRAVKLWLWVPRKSYPKVSFLTLFQRQIRLLLLLWK